MVLVVCSSVFQLYVSVVLKKTLLRDKKVDLILTDATPAFNELAQNEELCKLFNPVKQVKVSANINKLNRLQKSKYGQMFFELFPNRYAKKIWKINAKKYDECYFSSYTTPNVFLQYAVKKKNKKTKIHLYEDGISTYLVRNNQRIRSPKFIGRIFKVRRIEELVDDVLLFEPNLMCLSEYKNIVQIPKPFEVEGVIESLNSIFAKTDYSIKENFVFFEESFNNDGYITNDVDLINKVYELCEGKDFILKHHPRNRIDRFKTILPTLDAPIFWEAYLHDHNVDDKVLVTVSSNTVFVPHLLHGCKPTVVMLYKIFNGTSPILGSGNFENYIDKYLKLYDSYTNAKFYIPETVEEFEQIIKKLKKEEK